ncbi:MAG TPA: TIR domain-containing protein [Caulobacteraceae bacterium]|nr:TIR domain-containing protein [Caulobacteraceae bacterium]
MAGTRIFLSYRREDSGGYTEMLFDRLAGHYGRPAVFRDVHGIAPTERYQDVIDAALEAAAIVLVVIGRHWVTATDAVGRRRIALFDDVLAEEINQALEKRIPILPVLVGGAVMPAAADLPDRLQALAAIQGVVFSDNRLEHDFEQIITIINAKTGGAVVTELQANPFVSRQSIRDDQYFFNRRAELRLLRDYVSGKQNCQIVGPKRVGKSSLLLYVQRHCTDWVPSARVAYVDLQDARTHSLRGWLKEVADGLRAPNAPQNLSELMELIEDLLAQGVRPVVCLDEFGEMTLRPDEFTREVFLTLRSAGQRGMSMLTAATQRLSKLTDPSDTTSPFFNTFPLLTIGGFDPSDARRFVETQRDGTPDFTETERDRILEFAGGAPLALQAACYHVLAARETGADLRTALLHAAGDCQFVE